MAHSSKTKEKNNTNICKYIKYVPIRICYMLSQINKIKQNIFYNSFDHNINSKFFKYMQLEIYI